MYNKELNAISALFSTLVNKQHHLLNNHRKDVKNSNAIRACKNFSCRNHHFKQSWKIHYYRANIRKASIYRFIYLYIYIYIYMYIYIYLIYHKQRYYIYIRIHIYVFMY